MWLQLFCKFKIPLKTFSKDPHGRQRRPLQIRNAQQGRYRSPWQPVAFCASVHTQSVSLSLPWCGRALPQLSWGWSNAEPWASLLAQWVKNPLAMQETQETWVQFLGREYPLEEKMATHSTILT